MNEPTPTVLVVEDDPSVRHLINRLLQSVRLKVKLFGSAEELRPINRPVGPGCLVLDIRLPGISGLDLQRKLAQANIDIPIIFITGHGDIPMSVEAMKAGAVEFLAKPFRNQDLLDAVHIAFGEGSSHTAEGVGDWGNARAVKLADGTRALDSRYGCIRHAQQADRERD